MHHFSIEKELPFNIDKLYEMVSDIESYPKFIPWCSDAKIIEKDGNIVIADLSVCFKSFCAKYTSEVLFNDQDKKIAVESIKGPFKHLHQGWKFTKCEDDKTFVEFEIDFSMKSKILETMISLVFDHACKKMMQAFEDRAHKLFDRLL